MTTNATHAAELLLLGYGQLNTALAQSLMASPLRLGAAADRLSICAVSRSPRDAAASADARVSLSHEAMDLLSPDFSRLPEHPLAIIYCLTPSEMSPEGYRKAYVEPLRAILSHYEAAQSREGNKAPLPHVFFISSTGVYGQDDDVAVNEASPTAPSRFSGQIMLEAEDRLRASPLPGTAVRFSGIYGPTRLGMLRGVVATALLSESLPDSETADSSPFTNRIHDADCVGVLKYLLQRLLDGQPLEALYLASDPTPTRRAEVARRLGEYIRTLPTQQRELLKAHFGESLKKGGLPEGSGRAGSKRCLPERLLQTGYEFRYPDFMSGYSRIIEDLVQAPEKS
ncbi:hypothetical protein [Allohahella marinimesophila]|uniref:Nucleoside-diphosphate-sugar epimerase n=1 Tax=Allohahella marinimesophila TaxID=1054972 RepID=A0ABP7PAV1_9GAMM